MILVLNYGNISLKGKKKKVVLYTIEEEQTRG